MHRPFCVGGDCASVISVLPFSELMLRTYWMVMPWRTDLTPSGENERRGVADTFTLPAQIHT